METILEVRQLKKHYGDLRAVDGVDFRIAAGSCFGLLGPNGAGKTTTIEVVEGIYRPTSGEILYRGEPRTSRFHEEVGIQFQHTALLAFLTVRETLQTFHGLYTRPDDIERLLALCHLESIAGQYNDRISGGQRQRLLLAAALVNKPRLLFLDEPSTGLDPQARRDLWDAIGQIKHEGKTIVLTTHYMEEAQHLCDEIAIMDHGRIIASGSPEDLIQAHCSGVTVTIPGKNINGPADRLPLPFRRIRDRVAFQADNINACIQTLMAHRVDLTDMMVRSPDLEDVFLNLTGRQLRD